MSALQMKQEAKVSRFSQLLKWVGYLTAIFSLCATVWGVGKYLYSRAETRKNLSDLFATEAEQEKSHDYSSAWQTLEKAAKLDANSDKVRAAQQNLAMLSARLLLPRTATSFGNRCHSLGGVARVQIRSTPLSSFDLSSVNQ